MPPEWFRGFRPGQEEAVEEIVHHFQQGMGLVILDAPTGTGKTLIAEAVRERLGIRGLYLCSSLTLQDQFAHDFPYTKVLKGRSNYAPHFAEGKATCADCDKSKIIDHLTGKEVGWECTFCDPVWACPYEKAKYETFSAESGNTNTRYFLTEANNVGRFSNLPFVVLDECDVIETELMGFIEARVTNAMRKLLGLPMPKMKTKPESWVEWFEEVIPRVQWKAAELAPLPDDKLSNKRIYNAVMRLLADLKRVAPLIGEGHWVYSDYQFGEVAFRPVKVDQYANEYLWRHAHQWLCMSATIISPDEFVQSLGYEGPWAVVQMESPFDKERRPIRYAPVASMTFQERETEWPKMADGVAKVLAAHPDERILVHTNSYALSNHLLETLESERVRAYLDAGDRPKAIEWFEQRPDGVLLAASLDRGYDGADDLCRVVVCCKVPFPNTSDKQIEARLYRTPGGRTWYSVQTARSLVQQVGRGMRHSDDWCTVYILDKQFGRFWREWKKGGAHRLFPSWFSEAIVWGGNVQRLNSSEASPHPAG